MCVVGVECGAGLRESVVSSELEIQHITRGVCYWCEKAGLLIKKLPYLIKKLPYLRNLIDHSKPWQNSPHE